MGLKEILKLSWIKFFVIIVLLIASYYGVLSSAPFGPTLPTTWYIFVALFFIILIYLVISIIATLYIRYRTKKP
jgi:hypothetical protein